VGQYARQQLFRLWTKFHGFFSANVGGVVIDDPA